MNLLLVLQARLVLDVVSEPLSRFECNHPHR